MDTPTPEQIARHYSAMLDSVTTINAHAGSDDPDSVDTVHRNVEHLELMLERDLWAGYDLTTIEAAIAAHGGA